MKTGRHQESGMTLVEVIVGLSVTALASVAFGGAFLRLSTGTTTQLALDQALARQMVVVDRLVSDLAAAQSTTLVPAFPVGSTSTTFQDVLAVQGGVPLLSNPKTIELFVDAETGLSGIRIWEDLSPASLTPGPEDTIEILVIGVTQSGLSITRNGAYVGVAVTFPSADGGADRTIQSGITLRQ